MISNSELSCAYLPINAKEFQDSSNKSPTPYSTEVSGFVIYIGITLCEWINLFPSALQNVLQQKI
jgi:hypothetical protein